MDGKKYPDILRVDYEGRKRKFGGRHNSCPNSPTYRKYAPLLPRKLAQRYRDYDNIVAWHVSNEFGGECYCENCEKAFRVWLREKYHDIAHLNTAWNTSFWGHTFYEWDEIVLPDLRSEHFCGERTMFQGISIDYKRFMSDAILACYVLVLSAIGNRFLGARTRSEIAVLMDWDNWWAIEYSAGPSCDLHYLGEISRYYDALPQEAQNGFMYRGTEYPATLLCDLLHLEGAQQMDECGYMQDFYSGMPVLTKNAFGDGIAYYVATASSGAFYREFLKDICDEARVVPLMHTPKGVEVTRREKDGKRWLFVLNHNEQAVEITVDAPAVDVITGNAVPAGTFLLQGRDVLILENEARAVEMS